MCDYSLHHIATRPAQIEDKLVATKFPNSITRGFAAAGEPHVAVCLLPGTEIAFDQNVECEPSFGIGIQTTKTQAELANQHGQRRDPSRRAGIPGWAGGAGHAPVRGSARHRAAIARCRPPRSQGEAGNAGGSRAFSFVLTVRAQRRQKLRPAARADR